MGNGLYYKLGLGVIEPDRKAWESVGDDDAVFEMERAAGGYKYLSLPYEAKPDYFMVPLAYSTEVIFFFDDFPELQGRHVTALLKRTPDDFEGDNRFAVQLDGIPPVVVNLIGQDRLEDAAGRWRAIQDYWRGKGVTLPDPVPILVNDWD